MANELLRAAIHQAGIEIEDLAEMVQVDAKTARRWVSGRTPRGRYRTRVAQALGKTENELWPEADIRAGGGDQRAEIIAAYAQANDLAAPDWRVLLKLAVTQIDLLDDTLSDVISSPGVIDLLTAKAQAGCQIRILVSAPDSGQLTISEAEQGKDVSLTDVPDSAWDADRTRGYLEPLLIVEGIEARTFVASRVNSILRFDDQMLLILHTWGTPTEQAPLVHLRRTTGQGLFEQFAAHYDAIWQDGAEPVEPDPDNYPDPQKYPGRYLPPPADWHSRGPGDGG